MRKINKELLKSITILYVEDEDMIREELSYFFKLYIGSLYTAKNGEEALEIFKEINVDILITDIQMPKMNGLDLIKALDKPDIPIIVTTAFSDVDFLLRAIELNVSKFVIKPIDLEKLLFYMQECIASKRLKDKLYEKENLLKIINENVIISITDNEGVIIDASQAFCKLTGYSKEELLGSKHSLIKHEDTKNKFYKDMWEELHKGHIFNTEIKNRKKNGDEFWSGVTITPRFNIDNKIETFTAIRYDLTYKKRLELLAIEDEMTKLYNRRYFNKVIDNEIRRVKRENSSLTVVSIDIDYFKKYNDTYGHPKGDEALKKVSEVLKNNTLRAKDFAFRMGGEEFFIITSGESKVKSLEYTNNIVREIENLHIEHSNSKCSKYITISAGVVFLKAENIIDIISVYKYSDDALYKAKNKGRNQYYFSDSSD